MEFKNPTFILTLIVGLILSCKSSHSAEPKHLLKNGGFEDKLEGWNTYGHVKKSVETKLVGAVIKDSSIEGNRALYVSVLGPGKNFWSSGLQHKDHVFGKGKRYTLAAFLKMKKGTMKINFKPELAQDPFTKIVGGKFDMTEDQIFNWILI